METLTLILIGIISRFVPHPANVTAVGGISLFSAARLGTKKAVLIMFATMLVSDLMLGFHRVMWATYGSLMITIVLGSLLRKHKSISRIVGVTFISSLIFYLITNFAVWVIPGSMYPKTFAGLIECYILALPFFRNAIIGDLGYVIMLFYSYEIIVRTRSRISIA